MNSRRFISTPLATEEMSLCYQFSAHAALVCCIAMGAHERRLMWVITTFAVHTDFLQVLESGRGVDVSESPNP
jgi:hypothetical protein